MFRFVLLACAFLTATASADGQDYYEKNEDRATKMGVVTVATGEVTIKKIAEVYKVRLSIAVRREGQNETATGGIALIFLDEKGQPTFCPLQTNTTVSSGGGTKAVNGSSSVGIGMNAEWFEGASGYLVIVRSESEVVVPADAADIKAFLKTEVPSWEKVVDAYKELKVGDKSKTVGPAIIRRLK